MTNEAKLNREYIRIGDLLHQVASAIATVRHTYDLSKADSRALRNIELDCVEHGGYHARLARL